jgi:uncharacterized membrane protein
MSSSLPSISAFALFVHVAGVVVWVGGMAFVQFALRPAAAATLEPPQRLPLLAATLTRFFSLVTVSIVAVIASGFLLAGATGGFGAARVSVHVMAAIGLVMTAIYAYVRVVPFPRLVAAVAAKAWPDGAAALARVRLLVSINLTLGALTIAVATLGV